MSSSYLVPQILVIGVLSCLHSACSTSTFTGLTRGLSSAEKKPLEATAASNSDGKSGNYDSFNQLSFPELSKVETKDFVTAAIEQMSNDPIDLKGQTFSDLKDFVDNHESVYVLIADRFQTLGEYFDANNISSEEDIVPEKVEEGFALINKVYSDGSASDFLMGTSKTSKDSSDLEASTQSDRDVNENAPDIELLKINLAMALLIPQRNTSLNLQSVPPTNFGQDAAGQSVQEGNKDYNIGITINYSPNYNNGNNYVPAPQNGEENGGFRQNVMGTRGPKMGGPG